MEDRTTKADIMDETTYVITRSGKKEPLDTNQIVIRLQKLISRTPTLKHVNPYTLMLKVVKATTPRFTSESNNYVTTSDIDEESAHVAANLSLTNPYYLALAGRIAVDNHQKNTENGFYVKMKRAHMNSDEDGPFPLVSDTFFAFVEKYCCELEEMIDYSRDFLLDYFGIRMFQRSYSLKIHDKPIERPQDMFMREAIQVSRSPNEYSDEQDIKQILNEIKETYDLLSQKFYTHGSPTCYNSGGRREQLASCFLLGTGDSIEEIEKTGTDCSFISKLAGGIGVHTHSWRSAGSRIKGTNGRSSGIVPFLRTYETRLQAFNQGGRRPGSAAIYLMPHHPDILEFLDISKTNGDEKMRARDLFTAMWLPDIFMERVKENGTWSLFDPKSCGDLSDLYGDQYRERYLELETQQKYTKQIKARDLWEHIYLIKKLRGFPYICFSDTANNLSMHKNLGTVKSSNLCVTGDTYILTEKGYFPIKNLAETNNGKHTIWNGEEFTTAQFQKTSNSASLVKVSFSDGTELICTPEHRFAVASFNSKSHEIKTAIELTSDDTLIHYTFPVIDGPQKDFSIAQTTPHQNGFYAGEKTAGVKEIIEIPVNHSKSIKLNWLSGYLLVAGQIRYKNDEWFIQTTPDSNKKLLYQIKLLLNTLGCNPQLYKTNYNHVWDSDPSLEDVVSGNPDDEFLNSHDNTQYYLVFSASDMKHLYRIGLTEHQSYHSKEWFNPIDQSSISIRVKNVEPLVEKQPTYCFNEPKRHMGIFNGVLAMNCSEIYLYSDTQEYATCVLGSISLPAFVMDGYSEEELKQPVETRRELNHEFPKNPYFDFEKLIKVTKVVTRNLNNVVDKTYSPVVEAKRGNERHRPIGIGVQGLDDAYSKMRYPFDSEGATQLNKEIFECIYFAALTQSTVMCRKEWQKLTQLCSKNGSVTVKTFQKDDYEPHDVTYTDPSQIPMRVAAYPSIEWNGGSPISNGIFHWELYGLKKEQLSGMFDWDSLRMHIQDFGVKNSLLVALMPTASTSQLLGNNECFEPYTSNIYTRDTVAGQYIVIKKYLINDLFSLKLWDTDMKDCLMAEEGSIQNIGIIPKPLKDLYKTAYEIDQKVLVQQAIDRQPFIDQGQSLNLYLAPFTLTKFTTLMFQAWKGKVKTGNYYMHSEASVMPQKFTIDPRTLQKIKEGKEKDVNLEYGHAYVQKFDNLCEACSG